MANVLLFDRLGFRNASGSDTRELARRISLFEDRPEAVLTWSDVARHARMLWGRVRTAAK